MLIDILASERKPVGSTRTDVGSLVDLIGDEAPSPASGTNGSASTGPSTQDLLADIFGSNNDMTPSASSAQSKSNGNGNANADILSLFNSSSTPSAPTTQTRQTQPSRATPSNALFDMSDPTPTAAAPAPAAPAPPPQQRHQLQSYPAYEKHGLKITLTPRTAPGQPGMVQILARFTSTDGAQAVNFQVAVPKVSSRNPNLYQRGCC